MNSLVVIVCHDMFFDYMREVRWTYIPCEPQHTKAYNFVREISICFCLSGISIRGEKIVKSVIRRMIMTKSFGLTLVD